MTVLDIETIPDHLQDVFQSLIDENQKLKNQVKDVTTAAMHDELTGLLNRRGFLQSLNNAVSFSRRYNIPACLVFVDLNKFKQINDTHGHAAGDLVLKTVGRRIKRQVRSSDIVARLGGDEFVILLWQVTESIARWRGNLLVEAVCRSELSISEDLILRIGASAGVAVIGNEENPSQLLDRADKAMYQAKASLKSVS